MAKDEHTISLTMTYHYKGADGKASMWMHEHAADIQWEDGLKASVDSAFGTNIIVHFEGDAPFDSYVVTAKDIAQAARELRERLRAERQGEEASHDTP